MNLQNKINADVIIPMDKAREIEKTNKERAIEHLLAIHESCGLHTVSQLLVKGLNLYTLKCIEDTKEYEPKYIDNIKNELTNLMFEQEEIIEHMNAISDCIENLQLMNYYQSK